jgi:hypothetical protein
MRTLSPIVMRRERVARRYAAAAMNDSTAASSLQTFVLHGFPCSGLDWVAQLLAMHPQILMVEARHALGPLGGGHEPDANARAAITAAALAAAKERAGMRPGITHLGFVSLEGDAMDVPGRHFDVLRDGRDVLVHWTLAQLRHRGAALQRFLDDGEGREDGRMPEITRRFAADPDDVLVHNRGLLLWDRDWVRFAAHRWNTSVLAHFGAVGAHDDGRLAGEAPRAIRFEAARAAPRAWFDDLVTSLGLSPAAAPPFPVGIDPVAAATTDPERLAEWETGIWPRFFTARASRWFQMDGWQGLECVVNRGGHLEWEGECPGFPL